MTKLNAQRGTRRMEIYVSKIDGSIFVQLPHHKNLKHERYGVDVYDNRPDD
jgi:hypothetical protein